MREAYTSDIAVTGEQLPALRSRTMDAAMATQIRTGNVIVVRYADDSVFGFKSEETARRFLTAMKERLAKFGLTLNATKTRLIDIGRFAATNSKQRGTRQA